MNVKKIKIRPKTKRGLTQFKEVLIFFMHLDVYKRCTSRQVIENIVLGQVTHSVHPELVQCVLRHR